jgi:hypothetical protein
MRQLRHLKCLYFIMYCKCKYLQNMAWIRGKLI